MRTSIATFLCAFLCALGAKAESTNHPTQRIMLVVRACAMQHKDPKAGRDSGASGIIKDGDKRCETFRMRDSGPVEFCQEETFDVTKVEDKVPMTIERCQMGSMLQATMELTKMGITVCGATCQVEDGPLGQEKAQGDQ